MSKTVVSSDNALAAGADAIYCGMGSFNARRRAPKARVCGWWFDWRLRSYPAFQNAQILKSIVVLLRRAMPVLQAG